MPTGQVITGMTGWKQLTFDFLRLNPPVYDETGQTDKLDILPRFYMSGTLDLWFSAPALKNYATCSVLVIS